MKAEGISNLQAAHEENKDGCFSSATDWVHLKVLGENKSLWFLALIAQAYAHAPNPVISWNLFLVPIFPWVSRFFLCSLNFPEKNLTSSAIN